MRKLRPDESALKGKPRRRAGIGDDTRTVTSRVNGTAPATRGPEHARAHRVVVLALPGAAPLDLVTPGAVFGECGSRYRIGYRGYGPEHVELHGGAAVEIPNAYTGLDEADTVIVPGGRIERHEPLDSLVGELRQAHRNGTRIASICTGSFLLARAGLLDGRTATTHWRYARELAETFPRVRVDPNVLYVDEGQVITAAGATAGFDMCIHLVRRDFGEQLANAVARALVLGPHRAGDTAQLLAAPVGTERRRRLDATYQWILDNMELDLTAQGMAQHACLSVRAFNRRFREDKGMSPVAWLNLQRIRKAQRLLEETDKSIEDVAALCGFGSPLALRYHLRRVSGATPTEYRQRYARATAWIDRVSA